MLPAEHFRAPGIYIGLPEEDYFPDRSIGGSAIKDFLSSTEEWWWGSGFNTLDPRVDVGSSSTRRGNLVHCLMLEGLATYEARYAVEFDNRAARALGALDTATDLRLELERLGGVAPKSAKKSDLVKAVLALNPDARILAHLQAEHAASLPGKTLVPATWDSHARVAHRIAQHDPLIREIFSEGLPEVSVFWRNARGVPCRARIDWLRRDKTVDLKTYDDRSTGRHREGAWVSAIKARRYDLQEAHYREARAMMPKLEIYGGTHEQRAYVLECATFPDPAFTFVFAKTAGAPHVEEVWLEHTLVRAAQSDRDAALDRWADYYAAFGLDKPWFTTSSGTELNATDFPAYFGT